MAQRRSSSSAPPPLSKLVLTAQPGDAILLKKSALYRRSRSLYLKNGGRFVAELLSSPRSLGSPLLLENQITYSPLATELDWSLTDRYQKKDFKHFETIRSFVTSVFHEQNHRNLWAFLKEQKLACPKTKAEAFRFLNLSESLVVILDWALADHLEQSLRKRAYSSGVTYNPGSSQMNSRLLGKRGYRNALQVAFHATYLRLEGLHPDDLSPVIRSQFPNVAPPLLDRIVARVLDLDELFVNITNPTWQGRNVHLVIEKYRARKGERPLALPGKTESLPADVYLLAEKWLDLNGV